MAEPNFTVFERSAGSSTRPSEPPKVSIYKFRLIGLNGSAYAALGDNATSVELLFDPDSKMIGLRAAADGSPNAYRLIPNGNGRNISALAFLRRIGMELSTSRRWVARVENGVIVVDPTQKPYWTEGESK
jgi:hypothetical protein